MKLRKRQIARFQKEILSWYAKHKRDLPWRDAPDGASSKRNRDPYRILVSEMMLQQTQVSRVIPKYEAWMKEFPTVQHLAAVKTAEVLRAWSGLGYNRRALYLQKAARVIVEKYSSSEPFDSAQGKLGESRSSSPRASLGRTIKFPNTVEELMKLPGVGKYTAGAVACFAFGKQIAVVDTNIRRVILTQCQMSNVKFQISNEKEIQKAADMLLPKGKAYEWNQALMDYSAAMLKKEKILPRSGISLRETKQSRFEGSNRYYRGRIIKLLIEKGSIRQAELGKHVKDEFAKKDSTWLKNIVLGLEKEGFIRRQKGMLMLV